MRHTKFGPDGAGGGVLSTGTPSDEAQGDADARGKVRVLVVVDPRYLERESFVRYIAVTQPDSQDAVVGACSVEDWQSRHSAAHHEATILLNIGTRDLGTDDTVAYVRAAVKAAQPAPVVVMGQSEGVRDVIAAIDCGAQGYLSTSVGIDEIVEAARLVGAGGMFLPGSCISALREAFSAEPAQDQRSEAADMFTGRQLEVCNELRRGKSNKVIAYDLNLCESTVKVHIRNIMKKLGATNRTQAAFKLNSMYFRQDERTDRMTEQRR